MKDPPHVSWGAENGTYYTLLMTGCDEPTHENPKLRDLRVWLVMNIFELDVESGDDVAEYMSIVPKKGTGLHRYVFRLYKQPNGWIDHNEPIAMKW